MTNNFKRFMRRVIFLVCIILGIANITPPLLAQSYETTIQPSTIVLDEMPVPVTTGSGCNLVPVTTPQSIDIKFCALEETIEATTDSMIHLQLEVGGVSQVNLFELELEYDESQITYIEETLPLDGSILISKEIKEGKIKLLFGTMEVQELQQLQKIIGLTFQAKGSLKGGDTIQIKLNQCKIVSINDEDETQEVRCISQPKVITVYVIEKQPTPDINKDGSINLEDLSIAMKYYCIDSTQTLWNKAQKCDIVQDGKIDLADLIAIRTAMK